MDKKSHHLWSAEKDEGGNIRIKRNRLEKYAKMEKTEMNRDAHVAMWGLFGASLVDDPILSSPIPASVAKNFNIAAKKMGEEPPKVLGWTEIRSAYGDDTVDEIRRHISSGMRIRMASKYLNIPFVVAGDILNRVECGREEAKEILGMVRSGKRIEAEAKFGGSARRIAHIYESYAKNGYHKISVDQAAKDYWESYYGPFGKELVREIKKRVRADVAEMWMKKYGVDEAAAEYWSKYLGEYGSHWVSIVPKKISPSK